MRHIKRACTLLQVGCLLGLLLALPIGLNSGSTAFAEISSIGLSAEDTEQTEDAAGSVSDSLSSDIAQEGGRATRTSTVHPRTPLRALI